MTSPHQPPSGTDPVSQPDPGARPARRGLFNKFLAGVEWVGNLLPHPVTLFAIFAVGIVVISGVAAWFGLAVQDPRPEGFAGRSPDGMIRAVSLMNGDGLRRIVERLVKNFTDFAPLGTVLVAMLGVGVAEKSGLLSAVIRALVLKAPRNMVTLAVVFAGVLSNTASEMGYVVLIPLAAATFYSLGRHPIAGLAAAFAGVSGGYSANLLVGTIDPLLSGITQEAAQMLDSAYTVHPAVNWYFMFVSTFLITGIGTWVTARIVEPNLGVYDRSHADKSVGEEKSMEPLSRIEWRGILWAGIATAVLSGLIALCVVPQWGVLRNPETQSVLDSPFLHGMVALILVFFVVPGFVYGRVVGTMKGDRDIIDAMAGAMSSLGLYIVLVFFAAQFVNYFNWTNLGQITAVVGADILRDMRLDGPLVFIPFIILCAIVNLVIGSASAKWAVTAPIFVPMLMLLGYSPELTQCAYRIGDSTTNIITPMMSYFGLILAFAAKYDRKLGIGTLIATMLPYTIFFLIGWVALFYLWVFALGLPVGPEAPSYWEAAAPAP